MYAIVEILGLQYKVEEGRHLFINRINDVENGAKVVFDKVLLIDNDGQIQVGAPTIANAQVEAEVLDQVRGKTVYVFKKKRRKGYRKLNGHRQYFTQILIKSIKA